MITNDHYLTEYHQGMTISIFLREDTQEYNAWIDGFPHLLMPQSNAEKLLANAKGLIDIYREDCPTIKDWANQIRAQKSKMN